MITENDLLSLLKKVTLEVTSLENDFSTDRNGDEVKNRILHLTTKVRASSSIPLGNGSPITIEDNKVWINERDMEAFLKNCRKEGNVIVFEGDLHLDVSKPKAGRDGEIRVPARIWLVSQKFNKLGNQTRQEQTSTFAKTLQSIFSKVVDVSGGMPEKPVEDEQGKEGKGGKAGKEEKKTAEPKVVANGAGTGAQNA